MPLSESNRRYVFDLGSQDGSNMPGSSWDTRVTLMRGPRIGWRLIVTGDTCFEGDWSSSKTVVTEETLDELVETVADGSANLMLDMFLQMLDDHPEADGRLAECREKVRERLPSWRKEWGREDDEAA